MKIRYTFDNGETSEVEVSEEIGTIIMDSRRVESNGDRRQRYHCWSLDSIDFEGSEYGSPDFAEELLNGTEERNDRVRKAFSHLTGTQQRRMLMLAAGLSEQAIAEKEGVNIRAVVESIRYARKKFLKFF